MYWQQRVGQLALQWYQTALLLCRLAVQVCVFLVSWPCAAGKQGGRRGRTLADALLLAKQRTHRARDWGRFRIALLKPAPQSCSSPSMDILQAVYDPDSQADLYEEIIHTGSQF